MRRGRIITGVFASLLALTIGSTAALAATPRQIYADVAAHGKLTKSYSAADLARARQDASLQGYGDTTVLPVLQTVTLKPTTGVAGQQQTLQKPYTCAMAKSAVANGTATASQARMAARCSTVAAARTGSLPFTGVELSLFVAIGLALIGSGFLLRRTARANANQ
jgi:prophage DNA circulation protein